MRRWGKDGKLGRHTDGDFSRADGRREDAVRWARSLLSGGDFVVLDSETTGLGTPIDFVEVGVVSCRREVLFDSLMEPSCPVEPGATRVHGHTTESLMGERRFVEAYPDLLEALWGKRVVVYKGYDRDIDADLPQGSDRAAIRLSAIHSTLCPAGSTSIRLSVYGGKGRVRVAGASWNGASRDEQSVAAGMV